MQIGQKVRSLRPEDPGSPSPLGLVSTTQDLIEKMTAVYASSHLISGDVERGASSHVVAVLDNGSGIGQMRVLDLETPLPVTGPEPARTDEDIRLVPLCKNLIEAG